METERSASGGSGAGSIDLLELRARLEGLDPEREVATSAANLTAILDRAAELERMAASAVHKWQARAGEAGELAADLDEIERVGLFLVEAHVVRGEGLDDFLALGEAATSGSSWRSGTVPLAWRAAAVGEVDRRMSLDGWTFPAETRRAVARVLVDALFGGADQRRLPGPTELDEECEIRIGLCNGQEILAHQWDRLLRHFLGSVDHRVPVLVEIAADDGPLCTWSAWPEARDGEGGIYAQFPRGARRVARQYLSELPEQRACRLWIRSRDVLGRVVQTHELQVSRRRPGERGPDPVREAALGAIVDALRSCAPIHREDVERDAEVVWDRVESVVRSIAGDGERPGQVPGQAPQIGTIVFDERELSVVIGALMSSAEPTLGPVTGSLDVHAEEFPLARLREGPVVGVLEMIGPILRTVGSAGDRLLVDTCILVRDGEDRSQVRILVGKRLFGMVAPRIGTRFRVALEEDGLVRWTSLPAVEPGMGTPKYEVGDVVTMDSGWDRQVLHAVTISTVRANHGAQGSHRYWGTDTRGQAHGFYEDQIVAQGKIEDSRDAGPVR